MAKTVLITIEVKSDPKKVKAMETSVASLGGKVKSSSATQKKSFEEVSNTLDALGNRFRYLSLVASMAAGAMVMLSKSFVVASIDMENSLIGLSSVAGGLGHDMDKANKVAMNFASTGLMSVADSANALKQLLAKGYGLEKATDLMNVMTDSAAFNRQGHLSIGQAIRGTAEGIKNDLSMKTDNVGITKNLSIMQEEYAASIGTTIGKLTEAGKREAVYQGFMKEGALFAGNAALATQTLGGVIAMLGGITTQTSAALGDTLKPILSPLAEQFTKASRVIKALAEEFPVLTMVVITGSVAVTVLVASIAMLGALVPMVTGKMSIGITALKTMASTAGLVVLKFIALAVVIGTLIYLIAKVTGVWDKYIQKMKDLKEGLENITKVAKETNEEITDPKVLKQLKKLQDQMALTTRSFNENMAKWVRKHDETVTKLKSQINDLKNEYTKAVDKITSSFEDSQASSGLSHKRRVEDLQRAIDEEISLGIWGDQTKIRNLKKELAREEEDKAISDKNDEDRRDEDLKSEEEKYDGRLLALQEELDAAEKLEKDHAAEVMKWRNLPLLDYIDEQKRQYSERMAQLGEQMDEIKTNAEEQKKLNEDVGGSFSGVGDEIKKVSESSDNLHKSFSFTVKSMIGDNTELIANIALVATAFMGIITAIALVKLALGSLLAIRIGLWFIALEGTAVASLTGIGIAVGTLTAALASIPMMITITVLLGGFYLVMDQISKLKKDLDLVDDAISGLSDANAKFMRDNKKLLNEGKITAEEYNRRLELVKKTSKEAADGANELAKAFDPLNFIQSGIIGLSNLLGPSPFPSFKEGGVIPGSPNQAVPIIAHGGETVVPYGQSASPITVNINNPSVRNDNDIMQIANAVESVLSRRAFLKQLT